MSQLDVSCPNCQKGLRVPAAAVGKRIKCTACSQVFTVPGGGDGGPKPAKPTAKPAAAKPAAKPAPAKPAAAKPRLVEDEPEKPTQPARSPFAEEEDDGITKYDVTKDDLDVPRCPFCAKELESEEAQVCLNCGYDMRVRKRHASRKTYKTTGGDVVMWWLPAVIWFGVLSGMIGLLIWMCFELGNWWRKDGIFLSETENALTGKKDFVIHPMACDVCVGVIILGLASFGGPVIWRRLMSVKPPEIEKKK